MPFQEMKIKGAWIHTPIRHNDDRGYFEELFRTREIDSLLGHPFLVRQGNRSSSRKGVVRGIHYAKLADFEHKYVSCPSGSIIDFVVDLRIGSPTFGKWDSVNINPHNGKGVLISSGIGHAFLSLEDNSVAQYLVTREYSNEAIGIINPFDQDVSIDFESYSRKFEISEFIVSEQDLHGAKLRETFRDEVSL